MTRRLYQYGSNLFLLFGTTVTIVGCGDEIETLPLRPTMAEVQSLVFDRSCLEAGCHDSATRAGDLDLSTASMSRAQLMERTPENSAAQASGWLLVAPGDPERSFLLRKLDQPGLGEGAGMPIGYRLTPQYLAMMTRWVESSAR